MKNLHYELFHQVDYIGIDDKQKISFIMELVQHWGVSSIIAEIAEVLQMKKMHYSQTCSIRVQNLGINGYTSLKLTGMCT
jgi:hypothetical protein